MQHESPVQLAIVGSGPAGCFFAQSILRSVTQARITIFDRLASPFGLIRYGVAADHQHTKAITRQFERLFEDERVTFAGNISVGRDVSMPELLSAYDAVVLATGLDCDRALDVPGGELPGVYGAGAITRVLNSHPGQRPALPDLGDQVVIIGGGNVAIDLLRFLVKGPEDYSGSDIADHALDHYFAAPARRVTLLNRSDPAHAKSDALMIKELATLNRASYSAPELCDASALEGDRAGTARIAALAALTSPDRERHPGPEVTLRFGAIPQRVLGDTEVSGVEFRTGDKVETVAATSVLTAIGFSGESADIDALRLEHCESGRVEPGVYRTGWAKRGPVGAIAENRTDAKLVAEEVLADLASGALTVGDRPGVLGLSTELRSRAISYIEWQRLERHERESAAAERVRKKLPDHDAMLSAARAE